jgi:hypothetical protein
MATRHRGQSLWELREPCKFTHDDRWKSVKLSRLFYGPPTDAVALPTHSGVAKPPLAMTSTLTEPYQHNTFTIEVA